MALYYYFIKIKKGLELVSSLHNRGKNKSEIIIISFSICPKFILIPTWDSNGTIKNKTSDVVLSVITPQILKISNSSKTQKSKYPENEAESNFSSNKKLIHYTLRTLIWQKVIP